jgi:nitrate reductase gamma subunit
MIWVLTAVYALLFYAATAVLVVGLGARVLRYARVPSPLVIPTTPAPTSRAGVVARMFREVVFFQSLFRGNKWTWLFGWVFHFAMLAVLLRHLRYFTEPVWGWVEALQWVGLYAGFAMLLGLTGLFARRWLVDRVRYISAPSDYLMLVLLFAIAATGLLMKYLWHTDIVALKAFVLGVMAFDWQPLPADPMLLLHLVLVIALMLVFPFSKLLHAPGMFFSPTRNMVDNPREKRHLAAWARDLGAAPGGGK